MTISPSFNSGIFTLGRMTCGPAAFAVSGFSRWAITVNGSCHNRADTASDSSFAASSTRTIFGLALSKGSARNSPPPTTKAVAAAITIHDSLLRAGSITAVLRSAENMPFRVSIISRSWRVPSSRHARFGELAGCAWGCQVRSAPESADSCRGLSPERGWNCVGKLSEHRDRLGADAGLNTAGCKRSSASGGCRWGSRPNEGGDDRIAPARSERRAVLVPNPCCRHVQRAAPRVASAVSGRQAPGVPSFGSLDLEVSAWAGCRPASIPSTVEPGSAQP